MTGKKACSSKLIQRFGAKAKLDVIRLLAQPFGRRPRIRSQRGQTVVEYILMMFLIVSIVIFIFGAMKNNNFFFKRFTEPMVKHIVYNYKYGDPGAQGWDEGQPKKHLQISQPNSNATFRLFQPERNP